MVVGGIVCGEARMILYPSLRIELRGCRPWWYSMIRFSFGRHFGFLGGGLFDWATQIWLATKFFRKPQSTNNIEILLLICM